MPDSPVGSHPHQDYLESVNLIVIDHVTIIILVDNMSFICSLFYYKETMIYTLGEYSSTYRHLQLACLFSI